jgi:hypothetical protein
MEAMVHKVFEAEVKSSDDEALIVEHFISTERPDRMGDIVRAAGMRLNGKPVVLLGHGRDHMGREPVAKPLSIDRGAEFKGHKGILAKTQFFDDEVGQRLYKKTVEGYMPNWSIGFLPKKSKTIMDDKGRETSGREILEWELLEYSLVGVPAQPDAQTTGRKKEVVERIDFKVYEQDATLDAVKCKECGYGPLRVEVCQKDGIAVQNECPECAKPTFFLEEEALLVLDWIPDWKHEESDAEWAPGERFGDEKPYPNEHACRVNDPGKYDRIRRQNDKFGSGIHALWGVKGSTTELQAVRFSKDKHSPEAARAWLKKHDISCKAFEPAGGKEAEEQPCLEELVAGLTNAADEMKASVVAMGDHVKALREELWGFMEKAKEGGGEPAPSPDAVANAPEPEKLTLSSPEVRDLIARTVRQAAAEVVRQEIDRMTGKVR